MAIVANRRPPTRRPTSRPPRCTLGSGRSRSSRHHGAGAYGRQPRNASERWVARCLAEADIQPEYEPYELETGLTGRGMSVIRPDFYLPKLGIYIEVTLARRCLHLKQAKVRAAARLNQVTILLITRDELEALHSRHYTIGDFIEDGIANHAMELQLAA